jgi:glucokinase
MRVLAGDIGGTKTAMAIVEISERRLRIQRSRRYPSGKFDSLEEIVADFLQGRGRPPGAAGFGVAGPVRAGRSRVTKLSWIVDERRLAAQIGIARVRVINDSRGGGLGFLISSPGSWRLCAPEGPSRADPSAWIVPGRDSAEARPRGLLPGSTSPWPRRADTPISVRGTPSRTAW